METAGKKAINIVHTNITADPVSRHEILSWINNTLTTDIRKVEELCSGAAYCRLMDHLFGSGTVQLKRVKYDAKLENEYIMNFKILQMAFNSCGVDRAIPIEKLVKGRYNDNYDFAQWFKMFYDANYVYRRPEPVAPPPPPPDRSTLSSAGRGRSQIPRASSGDRSHNEQAKKLSTLPTQLVTRRPETAGALIGDISNKGLLPGFTSAPKHVVPQMVGVHEKLNELNCQVKLVGDVLSQVVIERTALEKKLDQILSMCVEEDSKPDQAPEMASLLHRIFRVIKRDHQVPFFGPGLKHAATGTTPIEEVVPYPELQLTPRPILPEDIEVTDSESEEDDAGVVGAFGNRLCMANRFVGKTVQVLPTIKEESIPCGDVTYETPSDADSGEF